MQRRGELPTWLKQRAQGFIQDNAIRRVLHSRAQLGVPWPVRLLGAFPPLRRLPARLIGIGVRPEHVRSPEVAGPPAG